MVYESELDLSKNFHLKNGDLLKIKNKNGWSQRRKNALKCLKVWTRRSDGCHSVGREKYLW